MKVATIIGARPQFIKAMPVSKVLRDSGYEEFIIHTGQHYDDQMSQIFFTELGIPNPDINLHVGSGPAGWQTGQMIAGIEQELLQQQPDWALVYGDTNSTLAGAIAASKLKIPIVHIEAGLRSFNRAMPEEINRIMADHVSSLLLCPSETAVKNLTSEGIVENVHVVGDVMIDALWQMRPRAHQESQILKRLSLESRKYFMATLHRAENTDSLERLTGILDAMVKSTVPIVFPLHPRTRNRIEKVQHPVINAANIHLINPIGYLDMVHLEQSAYAIITDSGGIQKEAYWLGIPCITVRDETEWVETLENGWNVLVGADSSKIEMAMHSVSLPGQRPPLYGDGQAAKYCVEAMNRFSGRIPR